MSRIFLIEEFEHYERFGFYTIRSEEKEDSETDEFILRFSESENQIYKEALDDLIVWIDEIGKRGLQVCQLRPEDEARALPPGTIYEKELRYLESNSPPLRLYCIPFPPNVMILMGGGIKSGQTNQDSPDLWPHFQLAKQLAKQITKNYSEREFWIEGKTLMGDLEIWL